MNDLRTKRILYKQQKKEINEYKNQVKILSQTEECLKSKWNELEQVLIKLEKEKGIDGYFVLGNNIDSEETQDGQEFLKQNIIQLNQSIDDKKVNLASLIKDLKSLKNHAKILQAEFDKKKSTYNSLASDLETNISQLEANLKSLTNEKNNLESNLFRLNIEIEVKKVFEKVIQQEMIFYTSTNDEDKANSLL